jgi:putative PIN family toxin of toxin-antitoxin system
VRVVLDTNIYISAILFGGNCEEILRLGVLGVFDILISREIIEELISILRNKFGWTNEQVKEVEAYIRNITTKVTPTESLSIIRKDSSDNKIIECAVSGNAHCIVTGDQHILNMKEFRGIRVLTPAEFLKL